GPAPAPVLPSLLQEALDKDSVLAAAYHAFPPYKQREFCESIAGAKREATKLSRLEKALEHIREGRGLSDKYRK
ncbi:MAG: YdeI/OmpD-associated family protein, partial [Bacteroidota bacterium]